MMNKFFELLQQSVIIQATVTLILTGVIAYLWIKGVTVPQELLYSFGVILGFYFGSKSQLWINARNNRE